MWVKKALLAICDGIDADEETQNVEKREQELQKHEEELQKLEEEIKKREQEIEKQKDGYYFISVKEDGIYLKDIKIINEGAEALSFVFKMLLKNKTDALLDHKKAGLKWYTRFAMNGLYDMIYFR
ncbi:hypothetical protein FACS189472_14840 [Alphaproteobacteria bacterium]|nr:hypothetical protein FACS189472_14840 [Alphaproteobacteria bacterium]